jgi:hypothetical protein
MQTAEFLLVTHTSSLTLSVAGILKEVSSHWYSACRSSALSSPMKASRKLAAEFGFQLKALKMFFLFI